MLSDHKRIAQAIVLFASSTFTAATLAAQDKYSVKVPEGLSFSEFKGYEDWRVVAISHTDSVMKVIIANDAMIDAYRNGIPTNGRDFPDGVKIAKIIWTPKKNRQAPFDVTVPDTLREGEFIEKDRQRFPKTAGWAYAAFLYNTVSSTYTPVGSGADCGFSCHTIVKARDYIFTSYAKR